MRRSPTSCWWRTESTYCSNPSSSGRQFAITPLINEPGCDASERSEEHTSELQSHSDLVCRLLLDLTSAHLSTLSLHDALPISANVLREARMTRDVIRNDVKDAPKPHELLVANRIDVLLEPFLFWPAVRDHSLD